MFTSSPFARRTLGTGAALVALLFSACSKSSTAPATASTITAAATSNAQLGTAGQILGRPLTVLVTDANGNPAPFQTQVTWTPANGGMVSAATDTLYLATVVTETDGNGYTSVNWMLGTKSGADSIAATVAGGGSTVLTATAQAGAVAKLVDQSGNSQVIPDGTTSQPMVVQAQDQYGNPVANVSINFTDQSGGTLSSGNVVTDANGMASVELTAAAAPASYTIVAAVAAQPAITVTLNETSN